MHGGKSQKICAAPRNLERRCGGKSDPWVAFESRAHSQRGAPCKFGGLKRSRRRQCSADGQPLELRRGEAEICAQVAGAPGPPCGGSPARLVFMGITAAAAVATAVTDQAPRHTTTTTWNKRAPPRCYGFCKHLGFVNTTLVALPGCPSLGSAGLFLAGRRGCLRDGANRPLDVRGLHSTPLGRSIATGVFLSLCRLASLNFSRATPRTSLLGS
jgi:hypothetical protein